MALIQRCKDSEMVEISIRSDSNPRISYIVVVQDPDEPGEAICGCVGYLAHGHCKHQQRAVDQVCRWVEGDGQEQNPWERENFRCPRCWGETEEVEAV